MNRIYKHNPDMVYRDIEGEYLLVPVRQSVSDMDDYIYRLDKTGAWIWKLLDGRRSIGGIVDEVAGVSGADRHTVEKDILEYIENLVEADAVILATREGEAPTEPNPRDPGG